MFPQRAARAQSVYIFAADGARPWGAIIQCWGESRHHAYSWIGNFNLFWSRHSPYMSLATEGSSGSKIWRHKELERLNYRLDHPGWTNTAASFVSFIKNGPRFSTWSHWPPSVPCWIGLDGCRVRIQPFPNIIWWLTVMKSKCQREVA